MHKITSRVVQYSHANYNQVLFGGTMMQWVDEAGAIFAREYTGEAMMVTLLFEKFEFHKPVKIGAIVDFFASEIKKGNTSITFTITAKLFDGQDVVTTRCVFVCVDKDLNKKKINWPEETQEESEIVKLQHEVDYLSSELVRVKEELTFYEP